MNNEQRSLLKMSAAIRSSYERQRRPDESASKLPVDQWNALLRVTRRIEVARRHGWHRAVESLTRDQLFEASYFQQQLTGLIDRLRSQPDSAVLPSGTDLYRDLTGLRAEFGEVKCDMEEAELIVTSAPIVLDGIYLGRFEIRLNWDVVDGAGVRYRVVALDPNPAAKCDTITHPHVQDERLCPGEGRRAIESALAQGRLFDFFVIVNQVLETYAPGNAFADLDDWNGTPCCGCGCFSEEDNSFSCRGCGSTLCQDCIGICQMCASDFCSNCLLQCTHCAESCCESCLWTCTRCMAAVCSGCRPRDSQTLCKDCHERETTEIEQAA